MIKRFGCMTWQWASLVWRMGPDGETRIDCATAWAVARIFHTDRWKRKTFCPRCGAGTSVPPASAAS